MKNLYLFALLCIGLTSCFFNQDEPIDLSDSRIENVQIVCCGVQSPQQNLPWLMNLIKIANSDKTLNYRGIIWLENYKGNDVFVTNMMLGSGGILYHYFDCLGNSIIPKRGSKEYFMQNPLIMAFAGKNRSVVEVDDEEFYSFSLNMKLDVIIYSNFSKF